MKRRREKSGRKKGEKLWRARRVKRVVLLGYSAAVPSSADADSTVYT